MTGTDIRLSTFYNGHPDQQKYDPNTYSSIWTSSVYKLKVVIVSHFTYALGLALFHILLTKRAISTAEFQSRAKT